MCLFFLNVNFDSYCIEQIKNLDFALPEMTMTGLLELIIFVGLIYWFFIERAKTMVDVISARMQETYVGLCRRSLNGEDGTVVLQDGLRNASPARTTETIYRRPPTINHKNKQIVDRDDDRRLRDNNLFGIKETGSKVSVLPLTRPFMGLACVRCTPKSKDTIVDKARNLNVINILDLGRTNSLHGGFFSQRFCDFGQAYRVQKFDYLQVSETVMNDERLTQVLEEITLKAIERGEAKTTKDTPITSLSIYKKTEKNARAVIKNMRSTISDLLLRITSWTLYKLLPYFVKSIAASPSQLEMLQKASNTKKPLIFVPLHRSHLDYILVSFILLNYNIRSPLVAAGDNLKIPFFGWLLRGLGAFYIKRRLENNGSDKDVLYRSALHTYMMHCLRAGHNIEFFIEGGRSRTGKPQLPKGGILSVILDAFLDGTIEDALLVPVSMNYEKLVDGNFVREQLGMPKQMESFSAAIKAIWNVLNSHYGNIRIDFNQPFSMQELVRSFQQQPAKLIPNPMMGSPSNNFRDIAGPITIHTLSKERTLSNNQSCSSLYGTDIVIAEEKGLVEAIARHVVYDCTQATAVMSTNVVAFLMLTQFREGCSPEHLAEAVACLTVDLLSRDRDVGYTGDPIDVVNHAINILGPGLIVKERESGNIIVKPVSILPNIIELSYYGNCLLPHYAMQSIVVTALEYISATSASSPPSQGVYVTDLIDVSLQLCELMSQEFILCKPCQNLEDLIVDTIDKLSHKGLISQYIPEAQPENRIISRNIRMDTDDDDVYQVNTTMYLLNQEKTAVTERRCLQTVLRPLMEVYCVTTLCLPRLLISENEMFASITETDFVQDVLVEMKHLLDTGDCEYGEALSTDAIKNCLKLLRLWGVVDLHLEGRIRSLTISKQYDSAAKLRHIHDLIVRFLKKPSTEQHLLSHTRQYER